MRASHCSKTYQLAAAEVANSACFRPFLRKNPGIDAIRGTISPSADAPSPGAASTPTLPQILRDPGQRSRTPVETDDGGLPPPRGAHTAPGTPLSLCNAGSGRWGARLVRQAPRAEGRMVRRQQAAIPVPGPREVGWVERTPP